jgi:hypothetical protein
LDAGVDAYELYFELLLVLLLFEPELRDGDDEVDVDVEDVDEKCEDFVDKVDGERYDEQQLTGVLDPQTINSFLDMFVVSRIIFSFKLFVFSLKSELEGIITIFVISKIVCSVINNKSSK